MNCCEQHKPYGCNEGRDCPVRASAFVTTDGGEQVNGSIAIQLHRQVMPPEPTAKRDRANALFWTIFVFAIASFAALIFLGVEPSLPFQPSEKP